MTVEVLTAIIGALSTLLAGGVAFSEAIRKLVLFLLGKKTTPKTYSERLSELTSSLTTASSQVDSVLRKLSAVAQESERRSAKRDYILFGAGVLVTTIITIVLQAISK